MKRIHTASIATLGCKLNQSESDLIARQLSDAGVRLVPFGQPADLYLINSCTVTHVGDRKSRHLIRQATRANPDGFVAVVGCYAEMDPEAISAIEGVAAVLGNQGKDRLLDTLIREYSLELGSDAVDCSSIVAQLHPNPAPTSLSFPVAAGFSLRVPPTGEAASSAEDSAAGAASRSLAPHRAEPASPRTRAFVKIQEGCDNYCSYCIVPTARGHQRSRPAPEVVAEINHLVEDGYQEVVLTGVNITAYGRDHGGEYDAATLRGGGLLRLLEIILAETEVPRIRLSSLQPEDWSPRFYDLWGSGRLCRHLHFSLQSGSDTVLRRMRRRYSVQRYAEVAAEACGALPGVAITTDVIAGFPGETDEEQAETERFLRSAGLAGLHVFKYSRRSGTPAAEMPDQVDPRTKQARSDRLIGLGDQLSREFRSLFLGSTLAVLWEEQLSPAEAARLGLADAGAGESYWSGLSDNYVRVYAPSPRPLAGTIGGARVDRLAQDGVLGTVLR